MGTDSKTLVTGASGEFGRLVCRTLVVAGHRNLIFATRTPENLAEFATAGAEIRRLDFDVPATLDTAFSGAAQALIISTDALSIPGRRRRQHEAALSAALRAGVAHIAYTSMPNPEKSTNIPFAIDHAAMEADLRHSAIDYSSLRNSWYQENLLAFLPQIVRDGVWFTAAGQGRIAYVARADAAKAAARVLTQARGFGDIDIAGPDLMTIEDIATLVSETLHRRIRVEHVEQSALPRELARQGVAAEVIPMIAVTDANQLAGHFEASGSALADLIDEPPRSLAHFLRNHSEVLLSSSAQ